MDISMHLSWSMSWIRVNGSGFSFHTPADPLGFSERMGIRRPVFRLGKWRIMRLDPATKSIREICRAMGIPDRPLTDQELALDVEFGP